MRSGPNAMTGILLRRGDVATDVHGGRCEGTQRRPWTSEGGGPQKEPCVHQGVDTSVSDVRPPGRGENGFLLFKPHRAVLRHGSPGNPHTLCFPRPKTQKQTPHHPLCLPVIWFLCSPLPSSPGCPLLMQPHTLSPVRVPFQNPAHDPCTENPFPTSLQGCVASSRSPP